MRQCARYFRDCLSRRRPVVSKDVTRRWASQKKLAGLPGGSELRDNGGGRDVFAMMAGWGGGVSGFDVAAASALRGGRCHSHSTDTSKKSAI